MDRNANNFKEQNFKENTDIFNEKQATKHKNNSQTKEKKVLSSVAVISHIQELSVIESKTNDKIDSQLFTLARVIQFTKASLELAITSNMFLFLFLVFYILTEILTVLYEIPTIPHVFLQYTFFILVMMLLVYFTSLVRFAIGDYTKRAILILFSTKMAFCLIFGYFIILASQSYEIYVANNPDNLISFIQFFIDYLSLSNDKANLIFNAMVGINIEKLNYTLYSAVAMNSFLPLFVFIISKYVFNINTQKEYEKY